MRLIATALSVLAVAALAGCSQSEDSPTPVIGMTWTVTKLISPDAVSTSDSVSTSAALAQAAPHLTIAQDGAVTGSAGCNRVNGTAEVHDEKVVFGPLATTRMACPEPVADVERAVLRVLDGEVRAMVNSGILRLTKHDGYGLELTTR